jgi:hypothetical protein
MSARRPTRRCYLAHVEARCEVYAVDPDGGTRPAVTPCPVDLKVGERIRIAGKTCLREGPEPERVEPVVCPDPLTNLEKRDDAERARDGGDAKDARDIRDARDAGEADAGEARE